MGTISWIIVFFGVAAIDVLVSIMSVRENNRTGRMLAYCLRCAAVVTLFYFASIMTDNHFVCSLMSSIYFCFIDFMLLYLVQFFYTLLDIRTSRKPWETRVSRVLQILVLIDVIGLMINPFTGHAISYRLIPGRSIACYAFDQHVPYKLHLLLCYCMIAYGFALLLRKARKVPPLYRTTYRRVILCVLIVVLMNAIYLLQIFPYNLDLSILFYSLLGYGVYISTFMYGERMILNRICQTILENSDQPLLIFDYNDRLFFLNEAGNELFPTFQNREDPPKIQDFAELLQTKDLLENPQEKLRFYWTSPAPASVSYICDHQILRDKKYRVLAQSFVFTNNMLGTDPLTGYQTEQYFNVHDQELTKSASWPIGLAVCDLNRLSILNNLLGYSRGNDAIALQAELLRKHMPERSAFVRLRDAKLCVICYGLSEGEIKARIRKVDEELEKTRGFSMTLKMDSAICMLEEQESAVEAAARANAVLKTRKLLDQESNHSGVIDALSQMLMECDPETESHVRRTRILGDNLSYDIGLSDYERDQLSLLCLFHDIGKVGIPLNILNKPGPLSDEERAIMQEHVQKGYRIARATVGLEIVAEPILHHHERWDGTGYPDGLAHEAIPILSRIISVVDAYDAMVTDRPYRKGISSEAALEELLRCAGTQFDPYIADAFVRMMRGAEADADRENTSGENTGEKDTGEENPAKESPEKTDASKELQIPKETRRVDEPFSSKTIIVNPVRYTRYILDGEMRILEADEYFEVMTGYTSYDVQNMNLTQADLMFEEDRAVHMNMVLELRKNDNIAYLEHRIRRKDGTGRYVYCVGIFYQENGEERTVVIVTDITDSISAQMQVGIARNRAMMSIRRLEESIQLDPMTGLFNKTAFQKTSKRELMNETQRCVLIMVDVDDFKNYNDSFGHPKGDELLIALAQALLDSVRGDDLVSRMGGDEFACLLKFKINVPLKDVTRRVQMIWQNVNRILAAQEHPASISAGAVCPVSGYIEFDDLYESADICLYQAKRKGKNQICIGWDEEDI